MSTHQHQYSASSIYNKPRIDYDPFKVHLLKSAGSSSWVNDSANVHRRFDFSNLPKEVLKRIPNHMLKIPDAKLMDARAVGMHNAQSTASLMNTSQKGNGRGLMDQVSDLLLKQQDHPGSQVRHTQSTSQKHYIRKFALAGNEDVIAASQPWLREGDESVLHSLQSLMIFSTNQYKHLFSNEVLILFKSMGMQCHFLQEVGFLEESGHTYALLMDMASLLQALRHGEVLTSVRYCFMNKANKQP